MQILRILFVLFVSCLQAACDVPGGRTSAPKEGAALQAVQPTSAVAARTGDSGPAASAPAPQAGALPADVVAFRLEREQCDHFRGEEPYDAQRRQELKQQLERFCKGTDARLAGLRNKYAAQPPVIDALKDFEDQVE